jgi:hypothetical protein
MSTSLVGAVMAVGVIFELPGVTQEQYDTASEQIDPAGPMEGCLVHVAGPMEGGWRVVEVWESQEAADRFFRERLQSVMGQVGITPVEPKVFPVHVLYRHGVD